ALSLLADTEPSNRGEALPEGADLAVFTSKRVDFPTRRLMQGFGLAIS
ncbi:MAG: glutamate racemase, partial [Mesorhizobium sp.]